MVPGPNRKGPLEDSEGPGIPKDKECQLLGPEQGFEGPVPQVPTTGAQVLTLPPVEQTATPQRGESILFFIIKVVFFVLFNLNLYYFGVVPTDRHACEPKLGRYIPQQINSLHL